MSIQSRSNGPSVNISHGCNKVVNNVKPNKEVPLAQAKMHPSRPDNVERHPRGSPNDILEVGEDRKFCDHLEIIAQGEPLPKRDIVDM